MLTAYRRSQPVTLKAMRWMRWMTTLAYMDRRMVTLPLITQIMMLNTMTTYLSTIKTTTPLLVHHPRFKIIKSLSLRLLPLTTITFKMKPQPANFPSIPTMFIYRYPTLPPSQNPCSSTVRTPPIQTPPMTRNPFPMTILTMTCLRPLPYLCQNSLQNGRSARSQILQGAQVRYHLNFPFFCLFSISSSATLSTDRPTPPPKFRQGNRTLDAETGLRFDKVTRIPNNSRAGSK